METPSGIVLRASSAQAFIKANLTNEHYEHQLPELLSPWRSIMTNIGAFIIIRIGFGVYYTIMTIRHPQNPILIIKAPTLSAALPPVLLASSQAQRTRIMRISWPRSAARKPKGSAS